MEPLAALLLAAGQAAGTLSVTASLELPCTVRSTPAGVLVRCTGPAPHVVIRPGRDQPPRAPRLPPARATIIF